MAWWYYLIGALILTLLLLGASLAIHSTVPFMCDHKDRKDRNEH